MSEHAYLFSPLHIRCLIFSLCPVFHLILWNRMLLYCFYHSCFFPFFFYFSIFFFLFSFAVFSFFFFCLFSMCIGQNGTLWIIFNWILVCFSFCLFCCTHWCSDAFGCFISNSFVLVSTWKQKQIKKTSRKEIIKKRKIFRDLGLIVFFFSSLHSGFNGRGVDIMFFKQFHSHSLKITTFVWMSEWKYATTSTFQKIKKKKNEQNGKN